LASEDRSLGLRRSILRAEIEPCAKRQVLWLCWLQGRLHSTMKSGAQRSEQFATQPSRVATLITTTR